MREGVGHGDSFRTYRRAPTWAERAGAAPVMRPNSGELIAVFGAFQFLMLQPLKTSTRTCSRARRSG